MIWESAGNRNRIFWYLKNERARRTGSRNTTSTCGSTSRARMASATRSATVEVRRRRLQAHGPVSGVGEVRVPLGGGRQRLPVARREEEARLLDRGPTSGCVDSATNNEVVPALLTPAMIASAWPRATGETSDERLTAATTLGSEAEHRMSAMYAVCERRWTEVNAWRGCANRGTAAGPASPVP